MAVAGMNRWRQNRKSSRNPVRNARMADDRGMAAGKAGKRPREDPFARANSAMLTAGIGLARHQDSPPSRVTALSPLTGDA